MEYLDELIEEMGNLIEKTNSMEPELERLEREIAAATNQLHQLNAVQEMNKSRIDNYEFGRRNAPWSQAGRVENWKGNEDLAAKKCEEIANLEFARQKHKEEMDAVKQEYDRLAEVYRREKSRIRHGR